MGFKIRPDAVRTVGRAVSSRMFGTPQRGIITGMIVALIVSMGALGATGNLFTSVPVYSTYTNYATYHVSVTPAAIPVGGAANVTAYVNSYIPNTAVEVNVSVIGAAGPPAVSYQTATLITDSHGKGSVTLRFPGTFNDSISASMVGVHTVAVAFAHIYTVAYAYSNFVVLNRADFNTPQIFMAPGFGPAGSMVSVHGYHFASDSIVALYYDGSPVATNPASILTGPSGSFLAGIKIPNSTGINSVKAQDLTGGNATSLFMVQPSSQPGPKLIASTLSLVANGSEVADFTSTVGVRVVLMGTHLASGTHSEITAALYDNMPSSVTNPHTGNSRFYYLNVLNATQGNATISVNSTQVKSGNMNSMQYWNGEAWVSAGSIFVSGDVINGIIPVSDLGNTPIVIGYIPPASHFIEYITIVLPPVAAAVFITAMLIRRKKKQLSE